MSVSETIGSDRRVATFLTCIGPDGIGLDYSLPLPVEKKNDMDEIFSKFQTYCAAKTNDTYEKFEFNSKNQSPRYR